MRGFKLVALGGAAAALLAAATAAVAGTGVGGVFNLGVTNTVNQKSTLTGATSEPQLLVQNTGSGAALRLVTGAGADTLKVSNGNKIDLLNADQLDGLDSTGFWKLGGNTGTTPGPNFLGTTDNRGLNLKVNGQRALRLEPTASAPNVMEGDAANSVPNGVMGATIGGGGESLGKNSVNDHWGTVGGGTKNRAGNTDIVLNNADHATVGGGLSNAASGVYSVVAGGSTNEASGASATVPGGSFNVASAPFAFAAGRNAAAGHFGTFVWADGMGPALPSAGQNTFNVRATGGIWLGTTNTPTNPVPTLARFIDTSTGGYLSTSGNWTNASDRSLKTGFTRVDRSALLERLARVPVRSWHYKVDKPGIRHIGPVAQDFYRAFGLGLDDRHISTVDEGGVALAAIQGLYRQNLALRRQNKALNARLTRLERVARR